MQLKYNSADVNNQTFTPQQFNEVKIIPKFKNSATAGVLITGEVELSATGYRLVKQKFSLADFNTINIQQMLSEVGIPASKTASGGIRIFVDGINTKSYFVSIKQ